MNTTEVTIREGSKLPYMRSSEERHSEAPLRSSTRNKSIMAERRRKHLYPILAGAAAGLATLGIVANEATDGGVTRAIKDSSSTECVPIGQGIVTPDKTIWQLVRDKVGKKEMRNALDCTIKNNPNLQSGQTVKIYKGR